MIQIKNVTVSYYMDFQLQFMNILIIVVVVNVLFVQYINYVVYIKMFILLSG